MVRRRRESGQALLFALLALLIASMAAALVAEDLWLRERALQEEAGRVRLRGLLDGALADALARVADRRPLRAEEVWGDGETTARRVRDLGDNRFLLRVTATYKARRGAAEAEVWLTVDGPLVQSWRRVHPGD